MGSIITKAAFGIASVDGARGTMERVTGGNMITVPPNIMPEAGPITFCTKHGSGLQSGPTCPDHYAWCCMGYDKNEIYAEGWLCCGAD